MAVIHSRIEINDTTPTMVTIEGREAGTNLTIQVQNLGVEAVYLGGEGLTSTEYGVSVVPGGAVTFDDLAPQDEIYALSGSGISYVAVLGIKR